MFLLITSLITILDTIFKLAIYILGIWALILLIKYLKKNT